jgi:hypothetical protein
MTVRSWNVRASGAAEVAPIVIILKKTQGSVWSEAGRTPLCPTIGWLRDTYGAGQYELRLKLGNRIACMTNAECKAAAAPGSPTLAAVSASGAIGPQPLSSQPLSSQPLSPTAGARLARPLVRTALGAW